MERIHSIWAQAESLKELPPTILVALCGVLLIFSGFSIKNGWSSLKARFDGHDLLLAQNTEIMQAMQKMLAIHDERISRQGRDLEKHDEELEELKKIVYPVKYNTR